MTWAPSKPGLQALCTSSAKGSIAGTLSCISGHQVLNLPIASSRPQQQQCRQPLPCPHHPPHCVHKLARSSVQAQDVTVEEHQRSSSHVHLST